MARKGDEGKESRDSCLSIKTADQIEITDYMVEIDTCVPADASGKRESTRERERESRRRGKVDGQTERKRETRASSRVTINKRLRG